MFTDIKRGFRILHWLLGNVVSSTKLSGERTTVSKKEIIHFLFAMLISLVVLISALYVLLSQGFEATTEKWATGAIGTMIGYWLK